MVLIVCLCDIQLQIWLTMQMNDLKIFVGQRIVCLPSVYPMVLLVTRSPWPSPAILADCKQSSAGGGKGLEERLENVFPFDV